MNDRTAQNVARHGHVAVTVERAQIDRVDGPARRAAYPKKPIPGSDGSADGWREQHRHSLGLTLIPSGNRALGVLEQLGFGRPSSRRFLFRDAAALVLSSCGD
jgi:hypothetical protein